MNRLDPAEAATGGPEDDIGRVVPMAVEARIGHGSHQARSPGTGRSYEEFWPGREVTLLAEPVTGAGTVAIPSWVCASTPALLVTRWSPARTRKLLGDVLCADELLVPELPVGPARPYVVVWVCPVDRWRIAAANGLSGVPGCIPWPPPQLLV
ncbi:MAG: hypothetical protein ACRDP6_32505 [Actinoallomurus sp.]